MGLFGALFAGVSGLDSQSNKIGIISNNIANVNTVGYKQGQASFDTLVVPSGTTSFSPGGVIGNSQQLVNQQGIISGTTSETDVAISGGGLMFVSAAPLATGATVDPLFTRSGSFTQDANGNFVNSDGYYLLGLPIDQATGQTAPANVQKLTTVNVSSSATGSATPTSNIVLAANFDANQAPLLGAGKTVQLDSSANANNTGSEIMVGNDVVGEDTSTGIVRGDTFTISSAGPGVNTSSTFTYGGFTIGRNVTTPLSSAAGSVAETTTTGGVTGGLGDGNNILDTESNVDIQSSTTTNIITVSVGNLAAYQGTYASISGVTNPVSGLTAAQLNGEWQIVPGSQTSTGGTTGTIELQLASGSIGNGAVDTLPTISNRTANFNGNIFDASTETDPFLGANNPPTDFTTGALDFSIDVGNVGTTTLQYSSSPNPTTGTFNNLDTLATAINDAANSGLTARVQDGRIYISALDPNNSVTFLNGDAAGNAATATAGQQLAGINWVQELDLLPSIPNTPVGNNASSGQAYMFDSLSSLTNAINAADPVNLTATINNPTEAATVSINEANSQQTIDFSDGAGNTGSLLTEFGFKTEGNGLTPLPGSTLLQTTGILPQTYLATSAQTDMSSGAVTPQFTKDMTIYDSLGKSHTIAINIAKLDTATATWAVELTAVPASDVVSATGDGQIAAGTVTFDGNGKITSETGLGGNIEVNWNPQTVGANPSSISLDLGLTAGSTNTGLTQAAGGFNVAAATQNGSPTGELTGVSIDSNGFVIAAFSNGQSQKMFQIPLANFTNPDGLLAVSGNAYEATLASGTINPELAGQSGVGTFTPSALEQSNVDLSTQLTDLIVAQQAYGANSKVLTVADQLLQELDQIIQ